VEIIASPRRYYDDWSLGRSMHRLGFAARDLRARIRPSWLELARRHVIAVSHVGDEENIRPRVELQLECSLTFKYRVAAAACFLHIVLLRRSGAPEPDASVPALRRTGGAVGGERG
jgi:hypothetical protein